MGVGQQVGKLADLIQKWDALWGKVPESIKAAFWMGVPTVITAVAGVLSNWKPIDIWLTAVGVGAGLYTLVTVGRVATVAVDAYAHALKHGPPPPPPEPPKVEISSFDGEEAGLEIRNVGGQGKVRFQGKILGVSGGKSVKAKRGHPFLFGSSDMKRGATIAIAVAHRGGGEVWIWDEGKIVIDRWSPWGGEHVELKIQVDFLHITDEITTLETRIVKVTSKGSNDLLKVLSFDPL